MLNPVFIFVLPNHGDLPLMMREKLSRLPMGWSREHAGWQSIQENQEYDVIIVDEKNLGPPILYKNCYRKEVLYFIKHEDDLEGFLSNYGDPVRCATFTHGTGPVYSDIREIIVNSSISFFLKKYVKTISGSFYNYVSDLFEMHTDPVELNIRVKTTIFPPGFEKAKGRINDALGKKNVEKARNNLIDMKRFVSEGF